MDKVDKHHYIFTDENGKVLDKLTITGSYAEGCTPGIEAIKFRVNLQEQLGKKVIAWAHMGGDNPEPTIKE